MKTAYQTKQVLVHVVCVQLEITCTIAILFYVPSVVQYTL